MNNAERIIHVERIRSEINRSRLKADLQQAKHEAIKRRINTLIATFQVWNAYNIAAAFGYRDSVPEGQEAK